MCGPADKDEEEGGKVLREGHRGLKKATWLESRVLQITSYSSTYKAKDSIIHMQINSIFSTHWLYYYTKQ